MLIQGLAPEDRDLARRAKTPGPGVMAKTNIINRNDTALSSDIGMSLPELISCKYFQYSQTCPAVSCLKKSITR